MGMKGSKESDCKGSVKELGKTPRGLSKEDLAGCLASLSDMAQTGIDTALPEIRINDGPPESMSPHTQRRFRQQLKARLQRLSLHEDRSLSEQINRQLELLEGLESQEDTRDWASMRGWLVWALHNNLDEPESSVDDDVLCQLTASSASSSTSSSLTKRSTSTASAIAASSRRHQGLQRQMSLDRPKNYLTHQASHSFEVDGRMSNQNSFDSTNANGET